MAGDLADIPYVQAHSFGGMRETTQVVVIHATDNTAAASGEAAYAARRTDQVSTHFFVDEQQTIQSVPLAAVAYGCLYHGNHRSVQFELCGRSNELSDATLRRAAPVVRRICDRYAIPVRKVSAAEVRAGVKGICGHADITAAWPEDHGTHTDPGVRFPWAAFIGYVQGDDDMALDPLQAAELGNAEHYLQALIGLTDTASNISNVVQGGLQVPNVLAATLKKLAGDVADLKARPAATLSDAQAAALAAQVTAQLGAQLTDAVAQMGRIANALADAGAALGGADDAPANG